MNTPQLPQLPFLTREMLKFGNNSTISLRLSTQSDASISLIVKGITREGVFNFRQIPTNDSILTISEFRIPDIPIFVSVVDIDGVLAQGQTFCRLSLMLDGEIIHEFASGWVYTQKSISWPGGENQDLRPDGGFLGEEVSADPAAGSEISITVPAGEIWKINAIRYQLTTDANVASRTPHLIFTLPTSTIIDLYNAANQQASSTKKYSYAPTGNPIDTQSDDDFFTSIPQNLMLLPTSTITTETVAIQAGDNYSAMSVYIERFFTPA